MNINMLKYIRGILLQCVLGKSLMQFNKRIIASCAYSTYEDPGSLYVSHKRGASVVIRRSLLLAIELLPKFGFGHQTQKPSIFGNQTIKTG